MTHEVIIAGHGGQGVLYMGTLLARGGMLERKEVSWLPSYGAEQRGGTASCAVVISEEAVVSPVVYEATGAIVLNGPSLEKFGAHVRSGGVLVVNSSLAGEKVERDDLRVIALPANRLAEEAGEGRIANMVALGAFVAATGIVQMESLLEALRQSTSSRRQHLLAFNERALRLGEEWARRQAVAE